MYTCTFGKESEPLVYVMVITNMIMLEELSANQHLADLRLADPTLHIVI
jgi:hypothetical protein